MEPTNAQAQLSLPDLPQRAGTSLLYFVCLFCVAFAPYALHTLWLLRVIKREPRQGVFLNPLMALGSASQMFTHLTSHPESWLQKGGGLGSVRLAIGPPVSLPRGRKENDCGHSDHRTQAASVGPCGQSIELRGCSSVLVPSLHVMCGARCWGCQDDSVTLKLR